MKLSDIKIKESFLKTQPAQPKLDKARKNLEKHGLLTKEIAVNKYGFLVDGYATYLVAKEIGIEFLDVYNIDEQSLYKYTIIGARHDDNPKIFYWKIGKNQNATIGDIMLAKTVGGLTRVTVVQVCKVQSCEPIEGLKFAKPLLQIVRRVCNVV